MSQNELQYKINRLKVSKPCMINKFEFKNISFCSFGNFMVRCVYTLVWDFFHLGVENTSTMKNCG